MKMAINRKVFFDGIRSGPFPGKLNKSQVDGITPIIDVFERLKLTDPQWLAYILATVFHETGQRMVPVREGFASTDAQARAAVASLYRKGRIRRDYAIPSHGFSWFGRGRVQNTHYENYLALEQRLGHPFTTNPSLLLDPIIDAEVTVIGHVEGIWAGDSKGRHKLSRYFNKTISDPIGARRIVNGTDKAVLIAGYHKQFHSDLIAAGA
jgi:putative chitinase